MYIIDFYIGGDLEYYRECESLGEAWRKYREYESRLVIDSVLTLMTGAGKILKQEAR